VLRPTMSTGLWVQMLGRGTRPYDWNVTNDPILKRFFQYKKWNCLVLDFANNTKRLGPINDPVIPKKRGEGPPGDAPIKSCPDCPTWVHASARVCPACGHEFAPQNFEPAISETASTDLLIASDLPQIDTFDVQRVIYDDYYSHNSGKKSIKATYYCSGMKTFWEYIAFEAPHKPYAIHKGHEWFRQRIAIMEPPSTTSEVYELTQHMRIPARIRVWVNKPGSVGQVMDYEF